MEICKRILRSQGVKNTLEARRCVRGVAKSGECAGKIFIRSYPYNLRMTVLRFVAGGIKEQIFGITEEYLFIAFTAVIDEDPHRLASGDQKREKVECPGTQGLEK